MTTQQHRTNPPTASASATTAPAPRRRAGWYIAAATVVVLGLLTAGAWVVIGVVNAWHAPDDFVRSALPGTVTVQVTETGTQWLYYEHTDGTTAASLDQLGIRITAPAGAALSPQGTGLTLEYDAKAGDLGTAIGTFEAASPGTYTVTADTTPAPGTAIAVGPSVAQPLKTPLLGAAAILGLCVLTSTGLVLTALRRR